MRVQVLVLVVTLLLIHASSQTVQSLQLDREYRKFNIWFKCPRDMSFTVENGDELAGMILGRFRFHVLSVLWCTMPTLDPKQVTSYLGQIIDSVTREIGLSDVSRGMTGEDKVKGHSMVYTKLTAQFEGIRADGAVGSWYCDQTKRLLGLLSLSSFETTTGFELFIQYMRSFDCHPNPWPCVVATAAYGSALSPQVQLLRHFRDAQIKSTFSGAHFIQFFHKVYYSFSPQLAQLIAEHESLRFIARLMMYPLIASLNLSAIIFEISASNPELAVLATLMLASSLVGIMYILPLSLAYIIGNGLRRRPAVDKVRQS